MAAASGAGTVPSVISVNVGAPRTVGWAGRKVTTSIWKDPVPGRVRVAGINVAGDTQSDLRVHGGPDKAVYSYSVEDYRWWASELGSELTPGTFGENLTVAAVDLQNAVVGEIWATGTARLVVTQPRMPCFKLGLRMGDAGFVQRFEDARRYGVYLRILQPGDVGAGDAITVVSQPDHGLTASSIADLQHTRDIDGLEALLGVEDVPDEWRVWAVRQLGRRPRPG